MHFEGSVLVVPCEAQEKQIQAGTPKTEWLETLLLSVQLFCPLITIPHTQGPHPANLLVHPTGDCNEPGQSLEVEGMGTFLERMNWAAPSLVFSSMVSSAGKGEGLGMEGATSGALGTFGRKGRRTS